MTAFRPKGAKTFKARVYNAAGESHIRTAGTTNEREAHEIQKFGDWLRENRRWRILDLIIKGSLTLVDAYDAHRSGRLERVAKQATAARKASSEPDLSLIVDAWKKVAASPVYVRQVRDMIPEGERFPLSQFTSVRISEYLDSLDVQGPTKNRYRAALSQFAKWLVRRGYLKANPVKDVAGYKKNPPRMVYYDAETSRNIIDQLEHPFRAIEAVMCGGGMEISAVLRITARDIDIKTRIIKARGTKTVYRSRPVQITDDWCWKVFMSYASGFVGDALLFDGVTDSHALRAHRKAVAAAKAEPSTNHDWRHTYAIRELRSGRLPQFVKRQLGHARTSTLLESTYAAFLPTGDDYVLRGVGTQDSATDPATTVKPISKAGGVS